MEKVSVSPERHFYSSRELATTVRGVHGHRASCTCGWKGDVWEKRGLALWEARWHRSHVHALPWEVVDETPPANGTD